jgi:hypothetical protein
MLDAMLAVGNDAMAVAVGHRYYTTGQVGVFLAGWGGHLPGCVLLRVALWRARVVPLWAAGLVVAGVPLMMSAYVPGSSFLLQVGGHALEVIGGIPVAAALLHGGREQVAVPAGKASPSTAGPIRPDRRGRW